MKTQTSVDNSLSMTKSAFGFISGTMLSRVSGLIRDMSMAFCFGTNAAIAAFLVAFRFANLLRRVFGEGALLTSFVPHFESHRNDHPKKAAQFFRDIFFSLLLLLIILIGGIELGLFGWLNGEESEDTRQIIFLTMIMLPGLLFICLFSICSGLLHCEKNFFLSGSAPIAFNVVWIGTVWILKDYSAQKAVVGLSIAITLAFFAQWLMTIPKILSFLRCHLSWKDLFHFRFFSPEIRMMVKSMSIGVIGVSAAQINSAIDTVFARYASLEGPAYLNYAIHLQQLPLALFGIGISSALLPPLSRAIRAEEYTRYKELLHFALSSTLTLLIPCSIAILVLGAPSINLIYGRGNFDVESTIQTTHCLWGYGIGLIPMGISLILTPAFYSRHDYWTPTLASLSSIFINVCLNVLFIFFLHYQAPSLAYATSLAACFNAYFLFSQLARKVNVNPFSYLFLAGIKLFLAAGIAGLAVLSLDQHFFNGCTNLLLLSEKGQFSRSFTEQISQFSILFICFISIFFLAARLFKIKEIFRLIEFIKPTN